MRSRFGPGNIVDPFSVTSSTLPFYPENPWLVLGYNAVVAVQVDVNANGLNQTEHAGRNAVWRTKVGWSEVRCALSRLPMVGSNSLDPGATQWRASFGRPIALDPRHRLVVQDPDRNSLPRYLYVTRPSENCFFLGVVWTVALTEFYNPRG